MPASTFYGRIDQLMERVGSTKMVAKVKVDQPYARYQHERLDLKHPAGGKAHYLRDPLFLGRNGYMSRIARQLLNSGPERAMISIADDIATGVFKEAPLEFGDLKASASPSVTAGGGRIYYRPPTKTRLTKEELRIRYRLRNLGFGNKVDRRGPGR